MNKQAFLPLISIILLSMCSLDDFAISEFKDEAEAARIGVTGVTLNKTSLRLAVGEAETLSAVVQPADAWEQNVTWNSSDTGKATVDKKGRISAIATGTAIITVTTADNGKTASCELTITATNTPNIPVITIDTNPVAITDVTEGSISGSLTVAASVTEGATPGYQWYSNTSPANTGGTAVNGATNASFAIPTTLAAGTYYYFCEVSASGGAVAVRSSVATVTVAEPIPNIPVITINTNPVAITDVTEGSISGSLAVAISVTEGATPSYQWYSNTSPANTGGTAVNGATNASFAIPTTLAAGTYYYFCEVSASGGAEAVRSNVATVTVAEPTPNTPVITINTNPATTTDVTEGNISGSLTVAVSVTEGAAPLYQWYSNTSAANTGGTAVNGETNASFAIPTTLTAGTYYYFCEVSASGGAVAVRSSVATVTVAEPTPNTPVITINTNPATTTDVTEGNISGSLAVAISVTEGATPSYQWYSNTSPANTGGTAVNGETNASFAIPTTLAAGTYYYFCEVSATGGAVAVRSSVATVTVAEPIPVIPVITINTHPTATTNVTAGNISGSLVVAASVTESATPGYQWYSNISAANTGGTAVNGETNASFAIPTTLTAGTYYYFCEVSASGGAESVRSNVATVIVAASGTFIITFAQLEDFAPNISVPTLYLVGNEAETTCTITVSNPDQYDSGSIQWQYNGTIITGSDVSGSFGETLTLRSSTYNRIGTYYITVKVMKDSMVYSNSIRFTVMP